MGHGIPRALNRASTAFPSPSLCLESFQQLQQQLLPAVLLQSFLIVMLHIILEEVLIDFIQPPVYLPETFLDNLQRLLAVSMFLIISGQLQIVPGVVQIRLFALQIFPVFSTCEIDFRCPIPQQIPLGGTTMKG